MTETSKEELVIVQNDLEEKIRDLEQKISLIPDPFSKLSMGQVRRGGTGAARLRRIPLYSNNTAAAGEDPVVTTHGSFDLMSHTDMLNANSDRIYYDSVIMPTDYIAVAGTVTFNYMYSAKEADNTIDWLVQVKSLVNNSAADLILLTDSTSIAAPSVVNTMSIRSVPFTILPKIDTVISALLQRTAGDANTLDAAVWGAWIEYVAFI
jgi:hypothetical protein